MSRPEDEERGCGNGLLIRPATLSGGQNAIDTWWDKERERGSALSLSSHKTMTSRRDKRRRQTNGDETPTSLACVGVGLSITSTVFWCKPPVWELVLLIPSEAARGEIAGRGGAARYRMWTTDNLESRQRKRGPTVRIINRQGRSLTGKRPRKSMVAEG